MIAVGDCALKQFYEISYAPFNLKITADSTRRQYLRAIGLCSKILGREAMLSDLCDDLVAAVALAVVSKGRSPATANGHRAKLVALWDFAARRGFVPVYPNVPRMKEYTRVPTAWTQDQMRRLWQSCASEKGRIADIPARDWWLNLHGVLWDTGVRIGTLVAIPKGRRRGLEWSFVDLHDGSVRIVAETQKQWADQAFRLHADTVAALRAQKPRHKRFVFPWPHCEGTLYNRYKRILERAELPHGPRDKFHRMRRTVASWYEHAGGNATELLGHSSRRVTMGYLDPLIVQRRHAADVLFRPPVPPPIK